MIMIQEKYSTTKILLFDVDDTLVITPAKIKVCDGANCFELTPEEFNTYEHQHGHILNFDDFKSLDVMKAGKLITKYIKILEKNYKAGNAIGIITARDDQEMIYTWLKEHVGFHITRDLIFAINDPASGFTGTVAQKKKQAMLKVIEMGYVDIAFFDDDKHNIKIIDDLAKEKGMEIKTHLAKK